VKKKTIKKKLAKKQTLAAFAMSARRAVGVKGTVSIAVTDDSSMKALNKQFRKKNKSTDVLSFPSDIKGHAGDIAISEEIASKQAKAFGHSLQTELKILLLHGMLHLAGYDHEIDGGKMARKESLLRKKFKLPVAMTER
jgi:probable rRNA maturation factor